MYHTHMSAIISRNSQDLELDPNPMNPGSDPKDLDHEFNEFQIN